MNNADFDSLLHSRHGQILDNRDPEQMDDKQEPVDHAEKIEGDPVKIDQQNGEEEREDEAGDQRHER